MTTRAWYDTFCDGPGCLAWADGCGGRTSRVARRYAKAAGWAHRRDGRDLCPDCAAPDIRPHPSDGEER